MRALTIIVYLFCTLSGLDANDFYYDHLSSEDGLSQNDINHIFQDSEGYMWFSTFDGLNRYDGYDFKIFRPGNENPGLHNNHINFITEDENKVLWISTNSNTIDRFDLSTERFIQNDLLSPFLSFDQPIIHIAHHKHNAYITCLNSFIILNNNNGEVSLQTFSNTNQRQVDLTGIRFCLSLNDSCFLMINQNHEIIKVECHNSTAEFSYWKRFNNKNITTLLSYKNGVIAAGALGIFYIDEHKQSYTISDKAGQSIIIDHDGSMWYGGQSGIYKFKPINEDKVFGFEKRILLNEEFGNRVNYKVNKLFIDNSGLIWYGLEGRGIYKYNPHRKKFHLYYSSLNKGSVASDNISKIFEDSQHNIWFGTKNAGLSMLPAGNKNQFSTGFKNYEEETLRSGHVRDIQELTLNGKLETYFATDNEDLNLVINPRINNQLKNIQNLYTSHMKYVNSFEQDGQFIWFGIENRGLIRYSIPEDKKKRIQPTKDSTSLASHIILDIHCDSKKRLWIATSNGISMLNESEKHKDNPLFINYTHDPDNLKSLSNNYASIIFETSQSRIVIGTLGGGLNIYNEATNNFSRISSEDGLPNDMIK